MEWSIDVLYSTDAFAQSDLNQVHSTMIRKDDKMTNVSMLNMLNHKPAYEQTLLGKLR